MKTYDLIPVDGRKSFYGKAKVQIDETTGAETLYSYDTKIITRNQDGSLTRHYDGWTATTGRHIKAFCGLNKAGFMALPVAAQDGSTAGNMKPDIDPQTAYKMMIARRYAG